MIVRLRLVTSQGPPYPTRSPRAHPSIREVDVTVLGLATPRSERESHLLNPPPGSTDPERFATVSIGIGDRVLFHPAPREPRHKWCEVSLRTETGRSQATCLGLSVGYPSDLQVLELAVCKALGMPPHSTWTPRCAW